MGIADDFAEHLRTVEESRALTATLQAVVNDLARCFAAGGRVLVCGNGGSAADAQHFAAELVGRFQRERNALPAMALTTDTSALTSIANDYGYDKVFARQTEALARAGDVLIALSTSGNSPNVVAAAESAKRIGCRVVALTGAGGGKLAGLADVLIAVPSKTVARIQEVHELALHSIAHAVEEQLFAAEPR